MTEEIASDPKTQLLAKASTHSLYSVGSLAQDLFGDSVNAVHIAKEVDDVLRAGQ